MEINKFTQLKKQGLTNQEIAIFFNVSLSTLKRFIKENDLTSKKVEIIKEDFLKLYEEGKKDEEIADILNVTKTKVINYRKSLNLKSQTDRLRDLKQKEFLDLYNQGFNDSEIARKLNVNNVTIHNWREKLVQEESNFEYKRNFDTNEFYKLYNLGMNYVQIAKELNVSSSAIQEFAKSNNLSPNTYNKDVPTDEQQQIIIGSLLGDMCLKMPKGSTHACGDFAHSLKQENYCKFIENKLRNFCSQGFYKREFRKKTNKYYDCYYVYMRASEYLTTIYHKFYINGIKIVPKDLLYLLDGRGIAIWYMDDGYKDGNTYRFSTNCFSTEDLNVIVEFFHIKYDINMTIYKNNTLRIKTESAIKFKNLIKDYVHPDCLYKI